MQTRSDRSELSPLRPREFFAQSWSGEGEWIAPSWLRRLARRPRWFSFTTATTWLTDDVWLVHDALIWENGRTEYRSGMARLTAENRIRLSYDDMLGGTDLWLRADGFAFSPYRILVAMPPLPLPLVIGAHDACEWDAPSQELIDTIRLRLFGLPIGHMVIRLHPVPPAS
ncbi:MAG: hypothetical protein JO027_16700 [Solirubrobacterales bacterium]|nr:hypothetical protein [Solirubrobacterales bacterium]